VATVKGKPRGYFQKVLAIDCETTGLAVNADDPSYNPKTKEEFLNEVVLQKKYLNATTAKKLNLIDKII